MSKYEIATRILPDGSVPCFESDTTQLRLVTEEEWFKIADEREAKS